MTRRAKYVLYFVLCAALVPLSAVIGDHSGNTVKICMVVTMVLGVLGMGYFSWAFGADARRGDND